ncbi:ferredoxin-NADP reductase family protein [Hibiscus syriacus]|uniref:Ferredoxin-NADP reductase family protein n=1 Tax=Hibiscus syriacus TaxID=106335 RepID=A0A6A2Z150_HIBSY|nr:uncharacterized protein LOC120152694 [Hibiscus syriacus]KAE8685628.1 ferredoxin-NADP reductase family protein [Hibiscus syriacus]
MPSFHATLIAAAITIFILLIGESTARELRPSDHGLEYQSLPPTGLNSPDAMSFFGSTSNSSSRPSTVAFPRALNSSNDGSWLGGGNRRRGSDRLRQVLLFGSLGCGVTGLALLTVSALVYFIKIRSTHNTNNNTNTSIVPIRISK